jgi:chromosome segregation ATPase
LRPAAFFCAVVPPWLEEERDEPECDFFPPRLDAPGEFAIRAARSFDIPFSFSASYCFSFLTFARFPGMPAVFPCSEGSNARVARYPLEMEEPREDSWESIGWETSWAEKEDLDREQVLQLARRLASQRERQRTEDLVQIEDLKRALRERAADVARRELEVERRTRELDEPETPRRTLRFRRAEKPAADEDRAYAEELLARRESELEERVQAADARERELQEREAALLARQLELEEAEPTLADREQRVAELEAKLEGLDAKEQNISERAATLDAAERELAAAREEAATQQRGLDERIRALAVREEELGALAQRNAATEEQSSEHERHVAEREAQLATKLQELRDRETEVLRLQAGLAAQQETIRRRERSVEDAERALARETVAPATAHVSFSEGLESLTGWRPRRD